MGTLQIGQKVRQELSLKWDKRKKHEKKHQPED